MAEAFGVAAIIVVSIAAVAAIRIVGARSKPSARAGRAFDDLTITLIEDVTVGDRVRVGGRAEAAGAGLTPRFHEQTAIGVHTTMQHHSDDSPRWAVVDECCSFWLAGERGRTFVEIDGPVHLLFDRSREIHHFEGAEMPPWMRPIWARNGLSFGGTPGPINHFQVDEALLCDGDEVEVMGVVNAGSAVEGTQSRVVIGADPEHGIAIRRSTLRDAGG